MVNKMLHRTCILRAHLVSNLNTNRGMATLKETSQRLNSVMNISKITKSMKMIASTKVNKAQIIMLAARNYAEVTAELLKKADINPPENIKKKLYVVMSTDRGLCGSINSGLTRAIKAKINDVPDTNLVVIGQKSRSQLQRISPDKIIFTFDQVSKSHPTWVEAAAVASEILKISNDYDVISLIYNKFKSVIAFEVVDWVIPKFNEDLVTYSKLNLYDYNDETFADYKEFLFANVFYSAIAEGYASEMSARRTSMENATNNAQEMIRMLTLSYNRSRQAVITNELIDIITGASAL